LRYRQFSKTTKEILLIILISLLLLTRVIIMNMQKKVYTIHFSHHLMTDSQPVFKQWSQNPEVANFANFSELKKTPKLPEKLELTETREFKVTETRRADSCPLANPHS